ncbi:aminopeptidase [Coprinopsis cinerea okayama7|uniref:Peptide hydrolase n=1 Tax=Coprinopsis cinerea (strain Okayama-7 / 130 / ATCC MYA-4618 / FGSC 9003) TaxID=240176 RepID=A8NAG6_COPC7|nr:aminopeptidase [Coprinopsis cinerea okayama7\|eukprot:XP_001831818.1 aminopeptidase [Coprinopsis cinerea okayama7\
MKWYSLLVSAALVVGSVARISEAELRQNAAQGLRLISLEEGVDPVWRTEDEVFELIREDIGFFDVTDYYDPNAEETPLRLAATSYEPLSRGEHVTALINELSVSNLQQFLSNLTSFPTRYYRSETGLAASIWIRDTVQGFIDAFPGNNASVALFNHTFIQPSIVARIPGQNPDAPIVVLGGHIDSLNSRNPTGPAPGADDDGSGSVNLLEALRVLLADGFTPNATVEFHWYAGEEGGLLGSQAIAKAYKAQNIAVKGMLQLDMTAYVKPGTEEVVGFISDFVDSGLTNFTGSLVDAYLDIPWILSAPCGYGCSDHASWTREGYPSTFPFEGDFHARNPVIHTVNDTVDVPGFSWTHSLEFTKLAVAFAVELSA